MILNIKVDYPIFGSFKSFSKSEVAKSSRKTNRMDNPSLVVNCGNPQITLNCQEENRNTITKCNEVTYVAISGAQRDTTI